MDWRSGIRLSQGICLRARATPAGKGGFSRCPSLFQSGVRVRLSGGRDGSSFLSVGRYAHSVWNGAVRSAASRAGLVWGGGSCCVVTAARLTRLISVSGRRAADEIIATPFRLLSAVRGGGENVVKDIFATGSAADRITSGKGRGVAVYSSAAQSGPASISPFGGRFRGVGLSLSSGPVAVIKASARAARIVDAGLIQAVVMAVVTVRGNVVGLAVRVYAANKGRSISGGLSGSAKTRFGDAEVGSAVPAACSGRGGKVDGRRMAILGRKGARLADSKGQTGSMGRQTRPAVIQRRVRGSGAAGRVLTVPYFAHHRRILQSRHY